MSTFDIALTGRLRHGELWKLVERFGSQAAVARLLGCSNNEFCNWVNMKAVPSFDSPKFAVVEAKLTELTGKTAEELWPDAARSEQWLQVPKSVVAHHQFELHALADMTTQRLLLPSPSDQIADSELLENLRRNVKKVLALLPYRDQQVITLRFGLNDRGHCYTYSECAAVFGLTKERIRQIERRALDRLRELPRAEALLEGVTLD